MDFNKYINQAKEAFMKGYSTMEAETRRHNSAMEAIKEGGADLSPQALSRKFDEETNAFNEAISKADNDMMGKVSDIQESFNQAVAEVYTLNGNMIDDGDAKILNCGITISADEMNALFKKHGKNPTMLRLLADYVEVHHIKGISEEATTAFFLAKEAGKRERRAFETFVHLCRAAVNMIQSGAAFSKAYYTAVDSISDYALNAEMGILKASPYQTDKEKARVEEIQNYFREQENKKRKTGYQ